MRTEIIRKSGKRKAGVGERSGEARRTDFRLPTSDLRPERRSEENRLLRLPTSDFRLPTSDLRPPTSDSGNEGKTSTALSYCGE